MAPSLDARMQAHASLVQDFLGYHFQTRAEWPIGHARVIEASRYSLLQDGGKRFRPVLALLTTEALGFPAPRALAFGAAVECMHTYSLIHDDLPAMDNDDFRRGQPTNHKKFDEATAILAGDGLLTEAFQIIADNYSAEADLAVRLIGETARAAGLYGMVGGQAIDLASKHESIEMRDLQIMHQLKTGALIRLSAVGAAILCRATDHQLADIAKYSENLGLAFQVADDLLDHDPDRVEPGSYPALLGPAETKRFLDQLTETCLQSLKSWPEAAEPLREIAIYNRSRKK